MQIKSAHLYLTFAALFWGGNYLTGKLLVDVVDPYMLSILRWTITTVIIFVFYTDTIAKDWERLTNNFALNFVFSLLGQVLFPLTLYLGLQYTTSLNAAIYMSATPAVVLLLNWLCFNESISRENIGGVLLSTLGVLCLLMTSNTHASLFEFNKGDILTFISAMSWAGYCTLLRFKDKQVNNISFVGFNSMIGTIILFVLTMVFNNGLPALNFDYSYSVILGILYLGLFPSWLAYVFWTKGVQEIGTTQSEIFTHLIPLSGGLLGIIFLNEDVSLIHCVSLWLIILGIIYCNSKRD